jgi:hypothetical protein
MFAPSKRRHAAALQSIIKTARGDARPTNDDFAPDGVWDVWGPVFYKYASPDGLKIVNRQS